MMSRVMVRLEKFAARAWLRRQVYPHGPPLVRLGSRLGGWSVPERILSPGAVAVCAGAGEDITFDIECNRRGLRVITVDPTPRAAAHVSAVLELASSGGRGTVTGATYDLRSFVPSRFTFVAQGLWSKPQTLRFYAPANPDHVSHSVLNLQGTTDYFEAPCTTLEALCRDCGIEHLDLLKLDIEGAEYEVLRSLADAKVYPSVLCVEFDELATPLDRRFFGRVRRAVSRLEELGYLLVDADVSNAVFVRAGWMSESAGAQHGTKTGLAR